MQAAFISRLCSNPWPSLSVQRVIAFWGGGVGVVIIFSLGQEIPAGRDFNCQCSSTFAKLPFFFFSLDEHPCRNLFPCCPFALTGSCLLLMSDTLKNYECLSIACSTQTAHCTYTPPCTAVNMICRVFHPMPATRFSFLQCPFLTQFVNDTPAPALLPHTPSAQPRRQLSSL